MVKVVWTELAQGDVQSIFDYISEDSEYYAKRLVNKFFHRVDALENFPKMGRVVPEFENESIRELIEGSYRIVYRILEDRVEIIRVRHASRRMTN